MFDRVRWQLTAWYVAVLAAIVLIFGAVLYVQLARALWLEQDMRLLAYIAAGAPEGHYEEDAGVRGADLPDDAALWLVDQRGQARRLRGSDEIPLDQTGLARARAAQAATSHTVVVGDDRYRSYTMPVQEEGRQAWVQALAAAEPIDQLLARTLGLIALIGGGSVLLAGIAGFFLAGRAMVPVRAAWQRQRDFASDASHELRTPLAVVHAAGEVLRQRLPAGSPEGETLDDLVAASGRMRDLVDDLLLLARADSGRLDLTLEPVDLATLARESVEQMRLLAGGLHLSYHGPAAAWVIGDRRRLVQVLTILLDNAIVHHRPPGWVQVHLLTAAKGRVSLSVADDGPGIPPEALPRLFDRFYRANPAGGGGTGLGLAIARELVIAHGGSIRVQSAAGAGTTFTVELPGAPVS